MKPIFTIHAGEYLVASEIESLFKNVNIWLPSKDTGVDLLLTDSNNRKTVSLQVKFSKNFNTTVIKEELRPNLKGCGWWKFERTKVKNSKADFWIFVIYSVEKRSCDYVIVKPEELIELFDATGRDSDSVHCYLYVTEFGTCFETRGLSSSQIKAVLKNEYANETRNFTNSLNNWGKLEFLFPK